MFALPAANTLQLLPGHPLKLNMVEPDQYLDGRPPKNSMRQVIGTPFRGIGKIRKSSVAQGSGAEHLKKGVDHGGESRITAGLKKYACFLTLDPNTAHTELSLSEDNRKVTHVKENQSCPDHPDRFDAFPQVLCRESVCGRCYWEIEWSGDLVFISVSYKSISRKGDGDECRFGSNDQSWSLICSPDRYSFIHNNIATELPVNPISSRIGVNDDDDNNNIYRVGVYVDVSAGTLSFYSVSDTMSLIHTEQITFTQTLCPGFYVWCGSVKLC
ncbi:Stonustoxin subunit beta [Labeo rohita]|uniref:Stonustoxin subunit beta n=1 Tax=Labeo rohita TaxID=84645 RepID=A0ABQ8L2X1_LABRO|nr:Stonustoxin subunit beta [Labeo rohita]